MTKTAKDDGQQQPGKPEAYVQDDDCSILSKFYSQCYTKFCLK